jgi:integrase
VVRIHTGFLVISARHLKLKNGVWWYQRRNPKDLREKLGLPVHVRRSLGTRDASEAAAKAKSLNNSVEAKWKQLRVDHGCPESYRQASQASETSPHNQTQQKLLNLLTLNLSEHLSPLATPMADYTSTAPLLSEALNLYLKQHPRGCDKRFSGNTRLAIVKVIEVVGDLRLSQYSRQHANKVRDHMLVSLKTASVRRRFDSISAVFKAVVDEHNLKDVDGSRPLENPFSGIRILSLGHDSTKREEFTSDELGRLSAACRKLGDDRRLIMAILIDTGARLGEIVGLRVSDVFLEAAVPHIHIRPYLGRSLKTGSSERRVPLVGEALWAAQKAVASKDPQGPLFPDYGPTGANSASAALNKWVREHLRIPKTMHGLRHTMKTRLRVAGVPEDIQNRIGGWTEGASVSRGYGSYPLELLKEHLMRVASDAKSPAVSSASLSSVTMSRP